MPLLIEKNSDIIQEICLHHISGKCLTENCLICQEDYDEKHHPNNYDCPNYEPCLQINYERLRNKLNGNLNGKKELELKMWVNILNSGLITYNMFENYKKSIKKEDYRLSVEKLIEDILFRDKINYAY